MSQPLYQIAAEYLGVVAWLERHQEENGPLDQQVIEDTLEGEQGDLVDKLAAVLTYAENLAAESDMVAEAEARMKARKERLMKAANNLREYALTHAVKCNILEIRLPQLLFKVQKNPPSVGECDMEILPTEYKRVIPPVEESYAPDKNAILKALSSGVQIPGASLAPVKYRWKVS